MGKSAELSEFQDDDLQMANGNNRGDRSNKGNGENEKLKTEVMVLKQ